MKRLMTRGGRGMRRLAFDTSYFVATTEDTLHYIKPVILSFILNLLAHVSELSVPVGKGLL